MTQTDDPLGPYRGRLLGLAYRMLGSRSEAEDVLQDAYLRYAGANREAVRNPEAYFTTMVTRLCLDRLKAARVRREVYVGPWLPEPVLDADDLSPEKAAEIAADLSFALLLTLERLSRAERAAFLLHDVFDAPFSEIAAALGKSEAACRQLAARARRAVAAARPGKRVPAEAHQALLERFAEAVASGDPSRLKTLLAADATAVSDGGGVKIAALNPIRGADRIARFLAGVVRKARAQNRLLRFRFADVNGEPGLLVYDGEAIEETISIDVADGLIAAVYVVRNPEKLRGLDAHAAGPV
ncbi:RNA polymerase sigma factor SigJ [Amphiplicatus metriothermophilus]|uniref:RNA polymerase, sigma subunit, ECF family n=1 Tax=Amphiplicatus metriothermophilus TaxID=1519374 RepID=A0A239PU46_9PROT|nr:RNA polymerase sigma factor SigJ [Amphiplicatus metriothermophilus]MBB5519456.1 RNA polymerase sigma-70 factor (ECF subfamily) [Amphiplicatus metriothermophilus]SNT73658.1 RNA polymerase, sigma subunit, ECF family [Amphiplicatus metriothermophilus]